LGEREIAEFVEDGEVEAGQAVGDASLTAGSTFGLKRIDESGIANPWTCSVSRNAQCATTYHEAALDQIKSFHRFERAGVRFGLHLQGRETSPEPLFVEIDPGRKGSGRLPPEVKKLKEERDIIKNAAAYFARKSPSGRGESIPSARRLRRGD
jgi:hypothetical protein